jgi:crotonobetainyl-CoA:carnitine CoA-transferase CaiB-like acyl-CoA transferase
VAEALADPRVAEREMVVEAGGVSMVGNPVRVSGYERAAFTAAPGVGEHTDEVLGEAG